MKILVINTVSFETNGITSVIMNYYISMDKSNMQIDFVTITKPLDEYVKEFNKNRSNYFVVARREGIIKYFLNLLKVMKSGKYDIVHVHGNSATIAVELFASKLAGIKIRIAHSHNTSNLHVVVHKVLYPVFDRLVTHRIACSEDAGQWLFRKKEFVVLKNSIDLERFCFDTALRHAKRIELGVQDKFVIGHIGTYFAQKNHRFIIELFSDIIENHPDCKLLLIGDGPLYSEIKQSACHLENNIIFIKKTMEIEKYMMAMDVFILPSIYEGFPVVSVEAQASDLPCVFSNVVTETTNMTGLIQYASLDNKLEWEKAIFKKNRSNRDSRQTIVLLTKHGFSIRKNAEHLRELYFQVYN